MQNSIVQHVVLNSAFQAAGADVVVTDGCITVTQGAGTAPQFIGDPRFIVNGSIMKKLNRSAEVLGIVTLGGVTAPTLTAATTYGIQIQVVNPAAQGTQPNPLLLNVYVTTVAVPASATALYALFRTVLAGTAYSPYVTATGGATLILTAVAGTPVITASLLTVGAGAVGDIVQTTKGCDNFGQSAQMLALGVPAALITATNYDFYSFSIFDYLGQGNTLRNTQAVTRYLWINAAATNEAAFITALDNVLTGQPIAGGAVADPLQLAKAVVAETTN